MKIKTSELDGAQLDYAVGKCRGITLELHGIVPYSTDWAHGGPVIEREGIAIYLYGDGEWQAVLEKEYEGPTPLIAAMRCYVASKLGEEVEVHDALGV